MLNFEVEGFEDGKLKIKLVYEDKENKNVENDILDDSFYGKHLNNNKTDALLFEKINVDMTKNIDLKDDYQEEILLKVLSTDNCKEIKTNKVLDNNESIVDKVKNSNNLPISNVSKGKIDSKSVSNTKINGYGKNNSLNEIINMIKKELNFSEIDKEVIDNVEKEIAKTTTDILIKEQIKLKTGEIKDIVKDIISRFDLKPETMTKL